MAAAVNWFVEFDRHDDLGTTLDPEEIRVADNKVVAIRGNKTSRGLHLHITLDKPVEDLTPADISVVRHRAAFSDVPPMKAISITPS